ncbi:hypothetical protein BDW74DRAFT_186345 [Aspergillus multicolor]|uniref:isopenicillin N synthase family dioxygenase n=1 Tax=Aspergillus multicolor TaxID=41759 RepID=UPI003CCD4EAA
MATTQSAASTYQLRLPTAQGYVYRTVLSNPARNCSDTEVPIIDISGISGPQSERQAVASQIREAAEKTGFFYAKNHGIPHARIDAALTQTRAFFAQPAEDKRNVSIAKSKFFNGWYGRYDQMTLDSEGRDNKEGFTWRYDPRYDPEKNRHEAGVVDVPDDVRKWLRGEEFVWEGTEHLPDFKRDIIGYWQECLELSRRLIRVFALALDLPGDYFDYLVTYPGSDGLLNYYPANTQSSEGKLDVGVGAHTDLQCFTLLWQDAVGGLQLLDATGQWIKVPPIEGTFVVNIGDYLMRLTNDKWKSTVHRVYNHSPVERYSMPFFFGFNFNEQCGVLPSCVDDDHPVKYEPISCGEWNQMRFADALGDPVAKD